MTAPRTAVVVGGGLAGTSAAIALADRGWAVTLLESRARLGGAAYSFIRDGHSVDTGQHVLLRCYTEYRALLRRIGAGDLVTLQDRMDIPVLRPGARTVRLRRAGPPWHRLPAPVHLLPALSRYSVLSPRERAAAARAMLTLAGVDHTDPVVDEQSFGGWLRAHRQGDRAVSALWGLLAVPALNIDVDHASLALAAQVFQTALLTDVSGGDVGVPRVPLSEIHDRRARLHLAGLGIGCHTRERVEAVEPGPEGTWTVRTSTGVLTSDAVVVAVPHGQAARIVPASACPDKERWERLGSSPIVTVHVRYDRRVTPWPFAAVLDSPVPWLFDRSSTSDPGSGQYLTIPLSAADAQLADSTERLLARYRRALLELLPAARSAHVQDCFVTREPQATFRQAAGSAALRPAAGTATPGLVLAGAWTATGWPDTMEGAVRSGLDAARALAPTGSTGRHRRTERSVLTR